MGKMTIDQDASIIAVQAEITGENLTIRPKMVLDTGATYVMIPWEIAEKLGIRPDMSEERIDITTASGVEKVPVVTLSSITVLGEKTEDVKAVVHDLPQRSYVDGLLGLSFLKRFNINLNFKGGVLEIE